MSNIQLSIIRCERTTEWTNLTWINFFVFCPFFSIFGCLSLNSIRTQLYTILKMKTKKKKKKIIAEQQQQTSQDEDSSDDEVGNETKTT